MCILLRFVYCYVLSCVYCYVLLCIYFPYRYEAIVPGNPNFIAEYQDLFFFMESEEKLMKFMK